jgi:hypothetical protein
MRTLLRRSRCLLLAAALAPWAAPAGAVTVRFAAEDLPEAPAAPDRWRYVYTLDAFPHLAGYGFIVYFDSALYGAIATPLPAAPAGWNAVAVQPDPLAFDGFYDAEAAIDMPSVSGSFAVEFTWLGAGAPGPQPFELREPGPLYAAIEEGFTVPEPGERAALAAALGGLAFVGRRRRGRGGRAC